jgi:sigma-B regulation protein RsbU (phosphoserine phosphatase)
LRQGQTVARRIFRRELAALPEAAAWLDAVAAKAGLSEKVVFDMQVCLEELFSNIVRHGKAANPARSEITIGVEASGRDISMTFDDEGTAFDVTKVPIPPAAQSLETAGGFGIGLIRSFSRNLTYERTGDRNRVIVDFSD